MSRPRFSSATRAAAKASCRLRLVVTVRGEVAATDVCTKAVSLSWKWNDLPDFILVRLDTLEKIPVQVSAGQEENAGDKADRLGKAFQSAADSREHPGSSKHPGCFSSDGLL